MTFATAPASIDNTGASDVTVPLTEWLNGLKGTRRQGRLRPISSATPGRYKVDAGLWEPTNTDLDLDGCALFHSGTGEGTTPPAGPWQTHIRSMWPRSRAVLHMEEGSTVFSRRAGARINGANRVPSYLGSWAIGTQYRTDLEAQHAIRVAGANCTVDLRRVEAAWTWGDGVYVEWYVHNTEIFGYRNRLNAYNEKGGRVQSGMTDGGAVNMPPSWIPTEVATPGIHHIGRQGIAQSGGVGLYVHDVTMWQVHRSLFDFEPGAEGTMDGITVERVTAGAFQNTWIAAAGNGYVNNVDIRDNDNLHRPLNVYCIDSRGHRRQNWAITGNRAARKAFWGSPLACMRFAHVDGVEVSGNTQYVDKRQAGRGTYFEDCTNVDTPDLNAQFLLV